MRNVRSRPIFFCILATVTMLLSGCNTPTQTSGRAGHWTHVLKARKSKPLAIDYRDDLKPEQLQANPALFVVSWHFVDADSEGLPSKNQIATFDKLERQLVPAIENQSAGVFAATITTDHQHDWYFYTSAAAKAESLAGEITRKSEFQSAITTQTDPDAVAEFSKKLHDRVQ